MWQLISGLFMGWSLGANDAANIFGLAVSTRVLKFWTAALMASVFVVIGALVSGSGGFETYGHLAQQNLFEAFLVSLAAAITVSLMTVAGWPVSTSQAVVGAIVGLGLTTSGVNWSILLKVVIAWVFTPVGGAIFAFFLYFFVGRFMERRLSGVVAYDKMMKVGFIVVGAYSAYSLGANNVANVTGVYVQSGFLSPTGGALIGSLAIAFGILTYSRKVIYTVGEGLVPLEPFPAFVALLGEALTLNVFAIVGVPVSASQAIVGAVLGIGLLKGVKTINYQNLTNIFLAWILTPSLSGIMVWLMWLSRPLFV